MKRNTILFAIFLTGTCLTVQANSLFQELSIEQGQKRAAQGQKLLFVHFSASWCMPNQWMEEHTFATTEVKQYLRQHYLAVKVNLDLPQGHADKEQYQVNTLPTLLIFSASGKLLNRIEGIMPPAALLQELRKYNLPQHKWARRTFPENKSSKVSTNLPDFTHLDKPTFTTAQTTPGEADTPISTPDLPMPNLPSSERPLNQEVVSLNASEYGVEVAILQDYGSVIRFVRNLERRFDQKVYIILEQTEQQKNYHIIIGAYRSRKEAYQLRSHLLDFQIRGSVTTLAFAKSS